VGENGILKMQISHFENANFTEFSPTHFENANFTNSEGVFGDDVWSRSLSHFACIYYSDSPCEPDK